MTAEEFEQQYAERSGLTIEALRSRGRVVRPCDCEYEGCEGWQSVSQEAAEEIDDFREAVGARRQRDRQLPEGGS